MAETNILDSLNQAQKDAVTHDKGPMLIVAGAGTGKTTVLINRLVYLVTQKKIDPNNILLLTFTEKAASEMVERADKALPYGYVNLWISTFHAFCEEILRDRGLEIGLNSDFRLINQTEQWILIKKNLYLFELDYYSPLGNPDKFVGELVKHFSRLKDENISSAEYLNFAEQRLLYQDKAKSKVAKAHDKKASDEVEKLDSAKLMELAKAYDTYNKLLLQRKFLDFGDLILYTLKLCKERPNILAQLHEQFKYIMVDEFQDTNWSQYELIKYLAKPDNNLMAVGDDDQAIYKFRGASIANIMQFKDDFPKAKEVVLNQNYRSAQVVLDKAHELIKHNNPYRLEEKLKIDKKLQGRTEKAGRVQELIFASEGDELATVAEMIHTIHGSAKNLAWSDIAVLARSNDTAERFAKELLRHQIPSQFVSMKGLYHKSVILDCLAYLKLLDVHHEAASVIRAFNIPIFNVYQTDIIKLNRYAKVKQMSLFEALRRIESVPEVSPESIEKGRKLIASLGTHYELAAQNLPSKVFAQVVRDIFMTYLDKDHNRDDFDHLNQFYRKILAFEKVEPRMSVKDLLEMVELEQEAGDTGGLKTNWEDHDVVRVMTVHSAKGLEFDQVFVVNLVDKRFPSVGMSDKIPLLDELVKEKLPEGDFHIQEERRLFYVAMTRAKSGLYLTHAHDYGGATKKKASVFIGESKIEEVLNMESTESTQLEKDLAILGQPVHVDQTALLPDKFSFSQLESFNNCPWQYRYQYILKVPIEEKASMIFGRFMHNTLKTFFSPCLVHLSDTAVAAETADLSWLRLNKIFDDNWTDYGYDSAAEANKFKAQGLKMLKKLATQATKEQTPRIVFLEKSFTIKINDYLIKGAIDRMDRLADGTVEIIDYKTGSAKEKLDFEAKKQLLLYQIAVSAILNLTVSKLTFYYLENGSKVSFTAKPEELEKVQLWILQTIESIKRFNFSPKPSHLCKFCDFRKICEYRQ